VGITTTQANNITTNTTKISYNTTDSTKVGYISITQAVDLDVVENKQDNQYKIIGIAMDYSNRVLSDSGTAEGSQSIMENIETLILN
jgi:archaellum biogenesis ATPase FlaH